MKRRKNKLRTGAEPSIFRRQEYLILFSLEALLGGIALAVFESVFLNAVEFGGVRPDLAVLAAVVAANRSNFRRAILLAFILGITRDIFSGGLIGMNAFALVLVTYSLIVAKEYFITDTWLSQFFVTTIGCLIYGIAFVLLKLLFRYEVATVFQLIATIVWTSLYTSVLAPIAFKMVREARFPSYFRLKLRYGANDEALSEEKI